MTEPATSPAEPATRLVRASAVVALGTLLSRITGLARVGVLAYALGQASLADSYNLANSTPNIIYELVVGGVLTATLVPVFVDHLQRRDDRATSAVFTVTLVVLAGLTVLAMLTAPLMARLYSIDASGAQRDAQLEVMTLLIRCFAPQIFFYGFTALAAAVLNARRRYAAAAYAPVLNNVVVVCVMLAFARLAEGPQEGWVDVARIRDDQGLLLLLGLGTTAGIAAMALVLVPAVARTGAALRPVFAWRHEAVRRVISLSGWTVGYVIANQLALLFVLVLAATGDAGDVSAYQYAFIFFQLPHGLFAVSIMTTVTPELARHATAGDNAGLRREFSLGLRYLLLVVVPSAVGLAVLAQPAVAVLVRGAFDAADAVITADVLQALAPALIGFSVYLFTLRGFYALQDTRTPFLVNVFENGANIVLAVALYPAFGVQGLALAYAGAYSLAAVVALALLYRRVGDMLGGAIATAGRAVVGSIALAIVAALLAGAIGRDSTTAAATAVIVGGTAGVVVYLAVLRALGTEELRDLWRALPGRGRGTRPADV
jgi:putative peptidoglycan lipid II flippase